MRLALTSCLVLLSATGALAWPFQTSPELPFLAGLNASTSTQQQTITTLTSYSTSSSSSSNGNPLSPGVQSSTSITNLTIHHQRKPPIKLRFLNRLRRPEFCREILAARKPEDLPPLVVIGRVKEVYGTTIVEQLHSFSSSSSSLIPNVPLSSSTSTSTSSFTPLKALVSVGRVVKGNQDLAGADIMVGGFNDTSSASSSPCRTNIGVNDTWILLLEPDPQDISRLSYVVPSQAHMLSMNLQNLDRINSIALDEPMKRRPNIEDILCEKHYCPYGRCKLVDPNSLQLTCACPPLDGCPVLSQGPVVCGSDNATYANECLLIAEACKQRRPLFVTKETAC